MINIDSRLLRELKGDELKLLSIMADYSNKDRTCWPSVNTLAKDCQWSADKVNRIKVALITKGLIDSAPRFKPNSPGQTSNLYTIKTTGVQNYTPTANLQGGGVQECPGGDGKFAGEVGGNSAGGPPAPVSDEVLVTEVLVTEELTNEALEREKRYLSHCIGSIFENLIDCFYPQLGDFRSLVYFNDFDEDNFPEVEDPTIKRNLKKILGAARAIYSAFAKLNAPLPEWREFNHSWSRQDGDPNPLQDAIDQIQSYAHWCELTGTWMTKDEEKLPGKILQDDWALKLKRYVDGKFPHEYDPMRYYLEDMFYPDWIMEYFYDQQMVYVDRKNPNRIF